MQRNPQITTTPQTKRILKTKGVFVGPLKDFEYNWI